LFVLWPLATTLASEESMVGPRTAAKVETVLKGARVLVVEARYYQDIADALLAGAKAALDPAMASYDVISVPGALEIPPAIAIALRARRYDGVVALGCVIRGETGHYDIVAGESARGLMDLGVTRALPVGNGILTVDTKAQASARASLDGQNKGGVAAEAVLALIRLKQRRGRP
jgi:6,7-dimethyl-8-ribityllumazine synthase